ncbi:TraG family conjugative transposon ATPase [Galbibacter pacificus]|uniref:TraG family conjugative transposon ATPase n=1 Tax=Galbibacter pacificus TaxID=2996052 RepID=A0ABT6FRV1_9FLAO|nr:TraG family conjugative transposon ATPase [Galbibacter pacificus]MDG3582911.1 TraG family conjugative transposon ATPase [Galbibacter pacificus]MDG3585970.1 TraG family conjugative transposon ATPase [Galbibacter pacificus]
MKINFNTYHPILDIQGHTVFAANGNLVLCYKASLPEVYSLSESDFEKLHGTWFQGLKALPVGTVIHKQEWYRKKNYQGAELPRKHFLQKATFRHFKDREYLSHESYLFFTCPMPLKAVSANPFRKLGKGSYRKTDEKIREFTRAVSDAVAYINNSRQLYLSPMSCELVKELTKGYFNGFQREVDTDVLLGGQAIQAGDQYVDVLAVTHEGCFGEGVQSSKANPKYTSDTFEFHQGFIDGLGLDIKADHIINHILYIDDRHQWRRLLDKRVEELRKSVRFGSRNKVTLDKVGQVLERLNTDESARIVRGHLNVLFWSPEAGWLNNISSKVKAVFKELDIMPYAPKGEDRKSYFLNSFFTHSSNFSNADLYVTDLKHALCLWVNTTNYRSDKKGIVFNDRQFNIPVKKDVWDRDKKRIKARNFAIFAPTGEGKSFLANHILRQYFEDGVRLVIIDLGGSYTKFAKLYPDDHLLLRYQEGKSLGINPFYLASESDLTPERLENLMVFLSELMAGDAPFSKGKEVALKKVLLYYYRKVRKGHSLNSLYGFVRARKESILKALAIRETDFSPYAFLHILSEYVKGGLYGFLFGMEEDRSFRLEDKRLIVFELDEIRDNKEVLSVMLKLIKTAVQRTIWRNRSERGIILFDEFAKQLKFKNVLESVEFYYQAIRKQNGAIGIILQSINQLPQNSASASILENTQVIYSLRNEKGYDALVQRLQLSGHDHDQLASLRNNFTGARTYTEVFIKIGKQGNVFRLEVPPEVYAAYLTDGKENEHILQLYKRSGCMEKAIRVFVKQQQT